MPRRLFAALPLFAVLAAAACSGHSSPAEPSGTQGAPSSSPSISGATIRGSIEGSSGLSVQVVGTTISSPVGASQQFVLNGVPAGDRQLRFTGAGTDAQLPVSGVQATETIELAVVVSGSSATVASQSRGAGSDRELEGRVEALPPTTPALTFVLNSQQIKTDGATRFLRGDSPGSFADLAIGLRAHVKATMMGNSLLATVVEIQNTNVDIPVEINGTVRAFSGVPAAFQFEIEGRVIKGDAATEFFGGSAFSNLANDVRAEVKGLQRNGFVYASRIHVNVPEPPAPVPAPVESASIEGTLTAKSGTSPNLTLTVAGTTVFTNGGTVIRRRGDVLDPSVLQVGMTVHVEGDRAGTGPITARMVQIKDDETGGLFEISGSMGGLHGSCPAIDFVVNGYKIFADGSTTFSPACSTFKSGTKVTVNGIRQADGSVKATKVQKQ